MTVNRNMSGLLAAGLTLAVLAVMGAVAAAPLIESSRLAAKITENRDALKLLRTRTENEASLREDNQSLVASGQAASLLIEGETTGIAGANLQKLMNDIVLQNGAKALSLQILRPTEDKELVRIGMSLTIEADIDGLRAIVHAIESRTPLIFIENIAVKGAQSDFVTPDPNFIGPLDVTLQIGAFTAKTGPIE